MLRSIEGSHDGRRIIIPVTILKPTPSFDLAGFRANALLDTGSTTTGITPKVAHALRLARRGKRPIGSAQGEGQAERYLFRVGLHEGTSESLNPGFPFVFEDVIGFELTDSFLFDALIGMDILSQCELRTERSGSWSLSFG